MIDWSRVRELQAEIGPEDFMEVVEIFLEEVDEGIQSLRNDASSSDLAAQLHFLKGSALNLGFTNFSRLCQSGERAAANGGDGQVNVLEILNAYQLSKTELLNKLDDQTPN